MTNMFFKGIEGLWSEKSTVWRLAILRVISQFVPLILNVFRIEEQMVHLRVRAPHVITVVVTKENGSSKRSWQSIDSVQFLEFIKGSNKTTEIKDLQNHWWHFSRYFYLLCIGSKKMINQSIVGYLLTNHRKCLD